MYNQLIYRLHPDPVHAEFQGTLVASRKFGSCENTKRFSQVKKTAKMYELEITFFSTFGKVNTWPIKKIYEQMPVKQSKFYDFQMSDFTPMVKYSLSTNSDNHFFHLYFIIMHGLKVIF